MSLSENDNITTNDIFKTVISWHFMQMLIARLNENHVIICHRISVQNTNMITAFRLPTKSNKVQIPHEKKNLTSYQWRWSKTKTKAKFGQTNKHKTKDRITPFSAHTQTLTLENYENHTQNSDSHGTTCLSLINRFCSEFLVYYILSRICFFLEETIKF